MHGAGKVVDDPYATTKDAAGGAQKMPLTSILTLDAKYFPEELFSSAEKRCGHHRTEVRSKHELLCAMAATASPRPVTPATQLILKLLYAGLLRGPQPSAYQTRSDPLAKQVWLCTSQPHLSLTCTHASVHFLTFWPARMRHAGVVSEAEMQRQELINTRVSKGVTAGVGMQTSLSALLPWRRAEPGARTVRAQSVGQAVICPPRKDSVGRTMKMVMSEPLAP